MSNELEQAEARLGSAEAYVLDRYGIKGEALDELYDAAIEVGRLRALSHERAALEEVRNQLWRYLGGRSHRAKAINAAFDAAYTALAAREEVQG